MTITNTEELAKCNAKAIDGASPFSDHNPLKFDMSNKTLVFCFFMYYFGACIIFNM